MGDRITQLIYLLGQTIYKTVIIRNRTFYFRKKLCSMVVFITADGLTFQLEFTKGS